MKYVRLLLPILVLTGCEAPVATEESSPSVTARTSQEATPEASGPSPAPSATPTSSPTPVNHAPAISASNQSVAEGSVLAFTVTGSDPDADLISFSCSAGCPSGLSADANGSVTWTPSYTQAGSYTVTFAVTDGLLSTTADITITVSNTNRAPTLASMTSQTVAENATVTVTPSASDPDGDTVVIAPTGSLPANATFSGGVLTFTPDYTQSGTHTVTFTATDGSLTDTESVNITVSNTNRAPVVTLANQSGAELQAMSVTVAMSDPDGDTVTRSASGLPTGASFNTSTGVFTWTPAANQEGTHNITFTASDGSLSDSKTVTFTIAHTNAYVPYWATAGTHTVTGSNTYSTYVGAAVDYDSTMGDGFTQVVAYTFEAHYDCNNKAYTKTYNSSTRTFALNNTWGSMYFGPQILVMSARDGEGVKTYKKYYITQGTLTQTELGQSYSTAGWCGAGTVYQH